MPDTSVCPHEPAVLEGTYDDEHGRLCAACADMLGVHQ